MQPTGPLRDRYLALYASVDAIVQKKATRRVVFNVTARSAGWYGGEYWVTLGPASPEPAFVRLRRMGTNTIRSLPYDDGPELAPTLATAILRHLENQNGPNRKMDMK